MVLRRTCEVATKYMERQNRTGEGKVVANLWLTAERVSGREVWEKLTEVIRFDCPSRTRVQE